MGSSSSRDSGGYWGDSSCTAVVAYDTAAGAGARVHHCSDFVAPGALVDHLRPGDIVQCKGDIVQSSGSRGIQHLFYSHFAVYIGNGEVVHVTTNDNRATTSGKAAIKRELLTEAFSGRLVRKANLHDEYGTLRPRPAREIIRSAREQVGSSWDYSLFKNNCEHFATLCRYGEKRSMQSWGFGDLLESRISLSEFIYQSVGRCLKQHCGTFASWLKRKMAQLQSAGNLAIDY